MTDFITFARAHGLVIHSLPQPGVWKRYNTVDKPGHKNGALKFMGDHGFVQNHATMQEVEVWQGQPPGGLDMEKMNRQIRAAEAKKKALRDAAAAKAAFIMHNTFHDTHAYLHKKGFPDEMGNIYIKDDVRYLVVPMRRGEKLVGAQLITPEGEKRFLFGQASGGAEFVFHNRGPHILCEGMATALSVREAMKKLKRRYTLHICFSAGNMARIAKELPGGFVVADNDVSGAGQSVAKHIGWPYWISDVEGEDANDAYQRLGLFKFSQSLQAAMLCQSVST
jgi:putative DNA primase/helicase